MLNFITQQRRGTTDEWAKSTVIPQAGEFVIEERKNAPIRIKLGDGVHLFKDLKYIDDATVSALTDLEARYNAHVAYIESGSPVPDSTLATEVLDARFIDGTSYASLNAAIQGVSDKRVSGMVYDYEGELGLKQPYMLYLTDKDNNIIEETGVRIISGAGGGGGGGGSSFGTLTITRITPDPFYVTVNDQAVVKFNFSGVDSSGEAVKHATATWKIDGKIVGYQEITEGENEYTLETLKVGKSKIFLSVVDDAGSVATKTWEVNNIELKVTSEFNDKTYYDVDDYLVFTCSPFGAVDKVIHIVLDGQEFTDTLSASTSGDTYTWEFPKQTHGSHYLHVYTTATINEKDYFSNDIYKDILIRDVNSNVPLIGCSYQFLKARQYETVNLEYYVYDPTTENPVVNIYVDDELESTRTLSSNLDNYAFQSNKTGEHTIKLTCSNSAGKLTEKIIKVEVADIGIDVTPITQGLVFDFNPVGHSNEDTVGNVAWESNGIHMITSDNFDWENGGFKFDKDLNNNDVPGSYHLCIKAGTFVTIDYGMFSTEAKQSGKEVKVIFKVSNVLDLNEPFLSCFDDSVNIGLKMTPQEASVKYQGGSVDVAYSENDIIEYEFNITPGTSSVPMVMCYEDGVSTRPSVYSPESHNFIQSNKKYITIGSNSCDINIYRFKVYQKSLDSKEILQNFIADGRTPDEIISRFLRNQIYDKDTKILTPESLSSACPWLRVYKLSAPYFTNDKDNKVPNTIIQQVFKEGNPVLDNWIAYNCMHSGQGTSSNDYGSAGRNLDFIMDPKTIEKQGGDPTQLRIELGDGSTTDKITLTRESIPTNYLNAKVNIASSNNITNALLARHYNRNNTYRRPFIREDSEIIPYIKDTMEFYNCAIFIQETDPVKDENGNYTNHREFNDTDWHFYAIGNIGDSKKTDKTRLTDMNDPYECCIEIMDVKKPLSAFPKDTMMNAMSVDSKTGEYIWAKDENLGILYEKQDDGTYELTQDETVDLKKIYYVDILEHEDFSENYTYGWRYISNKKDSQIVNYCKQRWIEFYRFLTNSSDEEFKQNFGNYFVLDSALYNYLFTLRYCMVDNRAKNTFWHYGKTGEQDSDGNPVRKWDLCWDYDNDTSLGLNNSGVQAYRYGLEDTDKLNGSEVFRQSDSTFFNRIRQNFRLELVTLYNKLDNSGNGTWNAQNLISEADSMQNEFPEELWRLDIERKYIRTYTKSFINGGPWKRGLTEMCNGRMKYHRRQWERSQEQYMASKFITNSIFNDSTAISLRGPAQTLTGPEYEAVPPKYEFTLTSRLYTYLNVRYGTTSGDIKTERVTQPGQPITLRYDGNYNDLLYVGNGKSISDLGDLSSFYLESVTLGNAPYLRNLTLGNNTNGYKNIHFEAWSSGNPLLENLNIENVVWKDSVDKTLNLKDMLSLKTIKAFGSNITSIDFAVGCKITDVELPKTLTSLTFKKLKYLTNKNIKLEPSETYKDGDYSSILDLTVEDCSSIDAVELLSRCIKLNRLRLTDVVFKDTTYEYFYNNIFKLNGIDASGKQTDNAWITGTAHFDDLTGAQLRELKTRYPNLDIKYNKLTCTIQYKLDVKSEPVYTQTVISYNNVLIDCIDPVELEMIEKPTKDASVSHTYEYAGWSKIPDGIPVEPSPLIQVAEDMVLYPTFNEFIRQYKVSFYNNDRTLLNKYDVDYGTSYFGYPDETPIKAGTSNPEAYRFLRWNPEPRNITGDLSCYATYELKPEAIYTLRLDDVKDFEYILDKDQKTLQITNYINNYNKIIKIASDYLVEDEQYVVTRIGGFNDKSLEYVELPESLVELDAYAFYDNKDITTITIPELVSRLGAGAFAQCTGLTDVYYNAADAITVRKENSDPYVFNNTFSKLGYTVHIGSKVKKIASYVFSQATDSDKTLFAARKVVFDNDSCCETLEAYAFWKTHCEDITFPSTLKTIGSSAFEYSQFKRIELPSNLISISSDSFSHCTELEYMYVPKSVETISSAALRYSLNVELDIEEGSKFVWINHCLVDTAAKTLLTGREDSVIPSNMGITSIADHCFTEVDIEQLVIPEGITTIGQYSIYNCRKLTKLLLPTTLIQLQSFAIYGCGFDEIILPMNLQSMGTFALVDNINLLNLTIPASTRSIGYRSFRGCTSLQSVTFECDELTIPKPDSAPYDLFMYDTNLTNIEVNWAHEDAAFANINKDAPWKAGTNSSEVYVNPVTVRYTDKTLVYNIDGSIEEITEEQSD